MGYVVFVRFRMNITSHASALAAAALRRLQPQRLPTRGHLQPATADTQKELTEEVALPAGDPLLVGLGVTAACLLLFGILGALGFRELRRK